MERQPNQQCLWVHIPGTLFLALGPEATLHSLPHHVPGHCNREPAHHPGHRLWPPTSYPHVFFLECPVFHWHLLHNKHCPQDGSWLPIREENHLLCWMPDPDVFYICLWWHSVQFSHSVVSHSLRPHESQHTRPPCPSPFPRVHSDSHPSSPWCHLAISSSVVPFSSCPQSLPASESFPMSQFAWGVQSTGASASASFLPKKSQGWSPAEWTGWISLQSKGLSRVFSNTLLQLDMLNYIKIKNIFASYSTLNWTDNTINSERAANEVVENVCKSYSMKGSYQEYVKNS